MTKRVESFHKILGLFIRNRNRLRYSLLGCVLALFAFAVSAVHGSGISGNVTADFVLGQVDFSNTEPSISNSQLNTPVGVAVDRRASPNYLYVVDAGNNRVLGWTLAITSGAPANLVIGQPGFLTSYSGTGTGSLDGPGGAAVDLSGNLFVADTGNNRVLVFTTPYSQPKVPPCTASSPCGGQTAGIVIGQASGNLCNNGTLIPSATTLCNPASVAVDRGGNLYVADSGNNRVLEFFTPTGATNPNCPGSGGSPGCPGDLVADRVFGQGAADNFATNSCGLGSASMCGPSGVAVDSMCNVYVSDSGNNRVLEFENPGTPSTSPCQGANTVASAVYGQGPSGADFSNRTPSGTTGENNATATGMNLPTGVAIDSNDNLYTVDSNNNRVLTFTSPLPNFIATVVFGQGASGDDITSNSCGAGSVGLCYASAVTSPGYLAFDSSADLFVVDSLNSRVLEYLAPVLTTPTPIPTPTITPTMSTPTATPTSTPTPSGQIKLAPMAIRFEHVKPGNTEKRKITITNQADSILSGTVEIGSTTQFTLQPVSPFGFDLTGHQKKEFFVIFKPTQAHTSSSTIITINSTDISNSPMVIQVTGSSKK
jgi:sugar lactone lactonase YvrE